MSETGAGAGRSAAAAARRDADPAPAAPTGAGRTDADPTGDDGAAARRADAGVAPPPSADRPETEELTPERAFRRTVEEGRRRLSRRLLPLAATGVVGGLDIGTGVLALLLVERRVDDPLLGGLAFSLAFLCLLLASSELFTEGFLVPVTAVVARKARPRDLVRLWAVTIAANLAGGWFVAWLIMTGFPELHAVAIRNGAYYAHLGFTGRSLVLAVMAGSAMTLMTWMQSGTESVAGKMVAAVGIGFLISGGRLFHSILDSVLMFAALHAGRAPFGYLHWLAEFGWAALGNVIGGVGLVTVLRLLQVPHRVMAERAHPDV